MVAKVSLVVTALVVVLASTAAASGGIKQPASPTGTIPSWALQGHMATKSTGGNWQTMPADLRLALSRHLAQASITAPCAPNWAGKTYTWYDFWKHFHVTVVLWTVTEKVAYCTDGSNVTFFYRMRSFKIPGLPVLDHVTRYNPWRFEGWQDDGYECPGINTGDGEHCYDPSAVTAARIAVTKAYFDVCLILKGICVNPQYPWVGIRVNGDGSVVKESGNG